MKTENIRQNYIHAPVKVFSLSLILHLSFAAVKNLILSDSAPLFLFSTIGFFALGFITFFIYALLKSRFTTLLFFKTFAIINIIIITIMTALNVYDYKLDKSQLLPGLVGGLIVNFITIPAVIFLISDFIIWTQQKFTLKRKC